MRAKREQRESKERAKKKGFEKILAFSNLLFSHCFFLIDFGSIQLVE
jgi:hypothetical protein